MAQPNMNGSVLFVCEHGAAKSVVAAAHFDRLAAEAGLPLRAVARGTAPDAVLTPEAVAGLEGDGLASELVVPVRLTAADLRSAARVITFGELPPEYRADHMELWAHIPQVSEDYPRARDEMLPHLERLVRELGAEPPV